MNPQSVALAVGIAGVVVMLATSALRRKRVVDLGTLSQQWMAEHRLGWVHILRR